MQPDSEIIKNVEVRTVTETEISVYLDHEETYGDEVFVTGYSRSYRLRGGKLLFEEDSEHSVDGEHEDSMSRWTRSFGAPEPGESLVERVIRDLVWDFGEDVAHPLVLALRARA